MTEEDSSWEEDFGFGPEGCCIRSAVMLQLQRYAWVFSKASTQRVFVGVEKKTKCHRDGVTDCNRLQLA